jgi:AbrB family looped-hinge helix DNA binding protein
MRTTIDAAGRVVIPKPIREEAGLGPGTEIEVTLRDGRIEIEAVPVRTRVVMRAGHPVIEADRALPPLTDEDVREVLEQVRFRR